VRYADDDSGREQLHIAAQLRRHHPGWLVLFGCYSRRYWAYPLFDAPPGSFFGERDPGVLAARMRQAGMDAPGEPPDKEGGGAGCHHCGARSVSAGLLFSA